MNILGLFKRRREPESSATYVDLNVVYITAREGLSPEHAFAFRRVILASSPLDFQFLNPGSFVVYFPGTPEGNRQGCGLAEEFRQFAQSNGIATFGAGLENGKCLSLSPPTGGFVGAVINKAMVAAIQEANSKNAL